VVHGIRQAVLPGVFFVYDFSPFMVRREESREPLGELLIGLCAVAGGVFTVARLLDAWVFGLSNWVKKQGGAASAIGGLVGKSRGKALGVQIGKVLGGGTALAGVAAQAASRVTGAV